MTLPKVPMIDDVLFDKLVSPCHKHFEWET